MRFQEQVFPFTVALLSFLSVLQMLDVYHVWYWPMVHRVMYQSQFDLGFSLVLALLPLSIVIVTLLLKEGKIREVGITFLVSVVLYLLFGLEFTVAWFSIFQIILSLFYIVNFRAFIFWLLTIFTGIEAVIFIHLLLIPFGINLPLSWFLDLELALFYIAGYFAPLIVVIIMCMWFLKPLGNYIGFDKIFRMHSNVKFIGDIVRLNPLIFLSMGIFSSLVAALYPYSPALNPSSLPVGVDVPMYLDLMAKVGNDPYSAFIVDGGSRPLILLLIYSFERILGSSIQEIVKYLPVILNPLLVFSVFFMVSQASDDLVWAALASFFTSMAFNMTIGMYSYYLANLLGLVFIYLAFGFLFNAVRTNNNVSVLIASVFGSLVVFTHPWTFIQYYAVMMFYLVYKYFIEKNSDGFSKIIFFLSFTGLIDLFKEVFIKGLGGYGSLSSSLPQLINILNFWNNNIFVFRYRFGGLLSNTIFLCLAAYGIYKLNRRDSYSTFLTLLIILSSIYYFTSNKVIQSRILYNIPFGVYTAQGVNGILSSQVNENIKKISIIFIIMSSVVYLLRSLGNLI